MESLRFLDRALLQVEEENESNKMAGLGSLDDDIEEISRNYHKIWDKPVDRSYVSRDFLRLANKFILSVEKSDGEEETENLFSSGVDFEHIVFVLNKLNLHTEPVERQKTLTVEKLKELVNTIEEHDDFGKFLASYYTEDSNVVKVLKCTSQTYIVLFLGSLGLHLYNACKLRAKDIRGSWNVIVKKDTEGNLSVIHRRKEQCVRHLEKSMRLEDIFQFTWEVEMTFNKEMSHFSKIESRVVGDVEWPEGGKEHLELEQIFLAVFSDPSIDNLTLEKLTAKDDDDDNDNGGGRRKGGSKKNKKKKKGWMTGFLNKGLNDLGSNIDFSNFDSLFDPKF